MSTATVLPPYAVLVARAARTRPPGRTGRDTGAFIEDVEWLIDTGESAEMAARRLGCNPAAIVSRLDGNGRSDLASYFRAAAWRQRSQRA